MARGKNSATGNEFDGTEKPVGGNGDVVEGPSEPLTAVDPDAALGGGGGSGGNGGGNSAGNRDSRGTEFDARIHAGPDQLNGDGTFRKRPGRKSGSGGSSGGIGSSQTRASKGNLNDAINNLTKTLVVLHTGIAAVSATPELMIDEEEGKMLASAVANVMDQFDLKPDPRTQAIVGLVIAAGTVYGPRAVAIQMRKAQEKRERKADATTGMGTAGVYDHEGKPLGTTEFQAHPAEWPVN